jgi:ribonuclease HI
MPVHIHFSWSSRRSSILKDRKSLPAIESQKVRLSGLSVKISTTNS